MICPKCKSENENTNVYCYKCGKKLISNEELTKKNFLEKLKQIICSINEFLDNILKSKNKTIAILMGMICIVIINICIYKHKVNNYSNSVYKPIETKKDNISKEQIDIKAQTDAEKKIIDDYIKKINNSSYTDYRGDSNEIDKKLNNGYFQSAYKKDAFLLRVYGIAEAFLREFNPKDEKNEEWLKRSKYLFTEWISYIDPKDISNYHIDAKKFFETVEQCGKKIYDIDIEKWNEIYWDRNDLSLKEWNRKYGEPQEPSIGMTKEDVCCSTWGRPENVHTTTTKYGTNEQWVYSLNKYIYFENGVVTAIQN